MCIRDRIVEYKRNGNGSIDLPLLYMEDSRRGMLRAIQDTWQTVYDISTRPQQPTTASILCQVQMGPALVVPGKLSTKPRFQDAFTPSKPRASLKRGRLYLSVGPRFLSWPPVGHIDTDFCSYMAWLSVYTSILMDMCLSLGFFQPHAVNPVLTFILVLIWQDWAPYLMTMCLSFGFFQPDGLNPYVTYFLSLNGMHDEPLFLWPCAFMFRSFSAWWS